MLILGPPPPHCAGLPAVYADEVQASYAVTEHLLALGHSRIAFFAGPVAIVLLAVTLIGIPVAVAGLFLLATLPAARRRC